MNRRGPRAFASAVLVGGALAASALAGCSDDKAVSTRDASTTTKAGAAATTSTAPPTTVDPSLPPAIVVSSPKPGDQVATPFHVTGTANTFEATLVVTLLDETGAKLYEQASTATSGNGTPGTFDVTVTYAKVGGGKGTLKLWEASAEDGRETNVVLIPVDL